MSTIQSENSLQLKYFPGGTCLPTSELMEDHKVGTDKNLKQAPAPETKTATSSKVWEQLWLQNIWHLGRRQLA